MKECVKSTLNLFCAVFTVSTLASIALNLPFGRLTDSYIHLLDRAVLCLIGSLVIILLLRVRFKYSLLNWLIPYIVFISLALSYVLLSSFWQELHPNAYRDIFLNDTIAYVIIFSVTKWYRTRKTQKQNDNEKMSAF